MKNKKGKLFLFLAALVTPVLLTSCEEAVPTSSQVTPTVPTSVKDTGSDDVSTSDTDDEIDDPYVISPEDSKWSEDVTAKMVQYLGGNVLPYINLGGDITVKYTEDDSKDDYRSYLTLTGGSLVSAYLTDAKKEYDAYDWTSVVYKDKGFYATREAQNLEISVEATSAGLAVLTAYWTEPWDDTSITEWKDVTTTGFQNRLGSFYNIPFVYLGTTEYTTKYSDSDEAAITITGGKYYDDNLFDSFTDSFGAFGWKVERNPDDASQLIATYAYPNGTTLKATLSKENTRAQVVIGIDEKFDSANNDVWSEEITSAYSQLTTQALPYVYLGSVYPTIVSAETNTRKLTLRGNIWDDSILTNARTTFAAANWSEVVKDTTTETQDEGDDNTEVENQEVSFSTENNGATYTVTISKEPGSKEGEYYPKLVAVMTETYDETSITAWPSDISSAFNSKFGDTMSDIVPFIYIGTKNPTINSTYTTDDKLVINGGAYSSKISDLFLDVTNTNDWIDIDMTYYTTSTTYNTSNSRVYEVALKTIDDVTYKVGLFTLYTGTDKTAFLEISRSEKDQGFTATDWSEGTKATLDSYFADLDQEDVIPFFTTLNSSNEISFISTGTNTGKLKLLPQVDYYSFDYQIMDMYYALSKANWDISLGVWQEYDWSTTYLPECSFYNLKASKSFGTDVVELKVQFSRITKSTLKITPTTAYCYIGYQEEYDEAEAPETGWGEELKNKISEVYGFTLPYFYMGTKHVHYTYDETANKMVIFGNQWSAYDKTDNPTASQSPIVASARAALTADAGFKLLTGTSQSTAEGSIANNSSAKATFEYTTNDSKVYTIVVQKTSSTPTITITSSESHYYDGSITEWSDSVKTVLSDNLDSGMSVPYIYLGTDTPTVEEAKTPFSGTSMTQINIFGGTWNKLVVGSAQEQLEEDGGWTISTVNTTTDSAVLYAYKLYANNTAVRLMLRRANKDYKTKSNSSATAQHVCLTILIDKADGDGVLTSLSSLQAQYTSTSAAEKMSDALNKNMPNYQVPEFLYTKSGDDTSTISYYYQNSYSANKYNRFSVQNVTYSAEYVYQAKAALEQAGYTTTLYPFSNSSQPTLVSTNYYGPVGYTLPSLYAVKTFDDGSKAFINLYQYSTSNTLMLHINPKNGTKTTPDNSKAGYSITFFFLDSYDNNTETAWGCANGKTQTINEYLASYDFPSLPFFNLGVPSSELVQTISDDTISSTITAYNYPDDTRLDAIKTAMENAGWSMEYRQFIGSSQTGNTILNTSTSSKAFKYLSGSYTDANGKKYTFDLVRSYSETIPTSGTSSSVLSAKTVISIGKYQF